MKFRHRLGKDVETRVLTEDFTTDPTLTWSVFNPPYVWDGVSAISHAGATYDYIQRDNVFVLGQEYQIKIKFNNNGVAGTDICKLYIGDYSILSFEVRPNNAERVFTGRAMSGDELRLQCLGTVEIDYIYVDRLDWNEPLEYEPGGWSESGVNLSQSDILDFILASFIDPLIYINDGFDYYNDRFVSLQNESPKEFCEITPVLIERYVEKYDIWETHFEGLNFLTDNIFNYKKGNITGTIESSGTGYTLKQNANTVVSIEWDDWSLFSAGRDIGTTIYATHPTNQVFFRDAIGGFTLDRWVFNAFRTLRQIIHEISNLTVTLEAPFLESGNYQRFGLIRGLGLSNNTVAARSPISLDIEKFLGELNIMFNIGGWGYENVNDIPILRIDTKENLLGLTQAFTLENNVSSFELNTIQEELYRKVTIGYSNETVNSQWTFNDYRAEDNCSSGALELESTFWASDDEIDARVRATGSTQINARDYVWIEVQLGGAPPLIADDIALSGTYNSDIDTNSCMTRHTYTLQSDFVDSDNNIIATKDPLSPVLIRIWDEFSFQISTQELRSIRQSPSIYIPFTSEYLTQNYNGLLLNFKFNNKNRSSTFKLKSE